MRGATLWTKSLISIKINHFRAASDDAMRCEDVCDTEIANKSSMKRWMMKLVCVDVQATLTGSQHFRKADMRREKN